MPSDGSGPSRETAPTLVVRRLPALKRSSPHANYILAALGCALFVLIIAACGTRPSTIVFISDRDGNLEIYSTDQSGKKQTNLTNTSSDESSPVVSPNGNLIAFLSTSEAGTAVEVIDFDGTGRKAVNQGPEMRRTHRWSPDSDRIAFIVAQGESPQIFVASIDGLTSMLLTSIAGDEVGDWSLDNSFVVFAVRGGEEQGIYVRNPDGVNEFHVTETPDFSPVWSPDSSRIAFISTRDGNQEIYVMNSDGTEQRRLTNTDAPEYDVSWSPNGKHLLYVSERYGEAEIVVTDLDAAKETRLTHNNAVDDQPVWSPKGRKIAFVSYLDGDAEIFIMAADGKDQVRVTNNDAEDTNPSW